MNCHERPVLPHEAHAALCDRGSQRDAASARLAGQDIIDLGMGNPDQPPPQHVIDKLCEVAAKPDAHGYSQSKGIPGLRRAQANYYARRFGVDLDPETEVVVTMGSKEGLSSLATAIIAPGDVVLAPNPSYPIHTFGFIIAGATIRSVPTTPMNITGNRWNGR
jgi:alanine-synthesizing transaminase